MNDITAFFAFLKYCLGNKGNMGKVVASTDWLHLYSFVSKQVLCDWLNTDLTDWADAMRVG